ncbi:MAG TPA: ABC transporter ATP-binding protein [Symbiobacteriaceae bacterium]
MLQLAKYLKPYRFQIAASLSLLLLQAIGELYLPTLMSDIVDNGIARSDTAYILKVGSLMLLVTAAVGVVTVLSSYLSARVAAGFGRDLRNLIFEKVEQFSLYEFDRFGAATLITRTTNDVLQVQQVMIILLRMMAFSPLMFAGSLILAVAKDPPLSLVVLAVIPVLAVGIWLTASKVIPLFKRMQRHMDRLNLVVREGLTGIRVIRAFNRTQHEQRRFQEANRDLTETAILINRIMAALLPLMMLVMNLTTVAVLWFGGIRIDQGAIQVGDLMAFIQYVFHILFSLMIFSMMFVMVPRASASASRIWEVLTTEPRIQDPPQPAQEPAGTPRGTVEFRHVTFRYPGAEQPTLSDVSFTAGPGEVTAIIGSTGSGKSALINLILRFYDVESGSILVNGVDIREMTQEQLRAKIGYVPQGPMLFSGTVADNIRFGKPDASEAEIRHALEVAQAAFVDQLQGGLEAEITQGGSNLSGGQKQRLTIARALVRRPEIYIFDDTFSALDFRTEARLREALRRETAGATVFIVTQRVSTVVDADRIIVLDEGRVAGIGTHQELLRTCPVYQEIVASQMKGVKTA